MLGTLLSSSSHEVFDVTPVDFRTLQHDHFPVQIDLTEVLNGTFRAAGPDILTVPRG
jgi:hypothetical protein